LAFKGKRPVSFGGQEWSERSEEIPFKKTLPPQPPLVYKPQRGAKPIRAGGKSVCPVWKREEAGCSDIRIDDAVAPVSCSRDGGREADLIRSLGITVRCCVFQAGTSWA